MTKSTRLESAYSVFFRFALIAVAASVAAGAVFSQSLAPSGEDLSAIRIPNFGRMDDRFYRGGQPKERDYQALKALGITTVIDLCDDPAPYEKTDVEALGMKYVNIPMS